MKKKYVNPTVQYLTSENIAYFAERSAKILIREMQADKEPRTVITTNNTPFKDFILKIYLLRNHTCCKQMKFRVELVASELHAGETRYHQEYKINILHSSYLLDLQTLLKTIWTMHSIVLQSL